MVSTNSSTLDPPALERDPTAASPASLWRDIAHLYFRPTALFERLYRGAWTSGAIVLLLVLYNLYAAAVISTGVLDYEAESSSETQIARFLVEHEADENTDETDLAVKSMEEGAIFTKLVGRVMMMAGGTAGILVGIGCLSGILFLVVALSGSKANAQVLTSVVAFSWYVEVPRWLLRLLLVSQLHASRVETSLAAFLQPAATPLWMYLLLRRLDPFDLWYWGLVTLGLIKSGQMRTRLAIAVVLLCALLAGLLRCGFDLSELVDATNVSIKFGQNET